MSLQTPKTVGTLQNSLHEKAKKLLQQDGVTLPAVQLFERLPRRPIISAAGAMEALKTTRPTAGRAIEVLLSADVLVEITGKKRDRVYLYRAFLDRLRAGTELRGCECLGVGSSRFLFTAIFRA